MEKTNTSGFRIVVVVAALLCATLQTFADKQPPTLVITTKDQVQHEYQLSDKAQVTFEGKSLVVTAPGDSFLIFKDSDGVSEPFDW